MMLKNYELLSPAGDMERLETALRFGADAVYCGGPMLQLRAGNTGFSMDGLERAAKHAHSLGKKLYVAVNAFAENHEVDAVGDYAQALHALGADAVIVSDLGLIRAIRKAVPALDVHVSTQANCVNYGSAMCYYDLGAKRVVLGREMSLAQIEELRARVPEELELECFVHGAMCMSYSGRCMISAYLTDRSANRGACTQSCRWTYHLMEQKRPGEFFPVEKDERGTTILSSFDLCCLDFLDRLMEAGVCSFKLEGRMKSPFYVASVTNAYRKRIDEILRGTATPESLKLLQHELETPSHRPYASGFYFGAMKKHAPDDGTYQQGANFVGVVKEVQNGRITFEQRNRIFEGDEVEILSPNSLGLKFTAKEIVDQYGEATNVASRPSETYTMACDVKAEPGDLLRIRIKA